MLKLLKKTKNMGIILNKNPFCNSNSNNIIRVIKTQKPTSSNNYTWYRLYSDGWVEQGGENTTSTTSLPITMADSNYTVTYGNRSGHYEQIRLISRTTTSFETKNADNGGSITFCWEVKGFSAQ